VLRTFWAVLCLVAAGWPAEAAGLRVVNAASYASGLAPSAIATAFGSDLAVASAATAVTVEDATGTARAATLVYAYPTQAAFVIPSGTAAGSAVVTVTSGDGTVSTAAVTIGIVAPGLFTAAASGAGVAAAIALEGQNAALIFSCAAAQGCTALPVGLNQTTLELYGTGIRGYRSGVSCTVGGVAAPVTYAGAQSQYAGLDQVNISLPNSLANQGLLDIVLTVDGQTANTVTINSSGADYYVAIDGRKTRAAA